MDERCALCAWLQGEKLTPGSTLFLLQGLSEIRILELQASESQRKPPKLEYFGLNIHNHKELQPINCRILSWPGFGKEQIQEEDPSNGRKGLGVVLMGERTALI